MSSNTNNIVYDFYLAIGNYLLCEYSNDIYELYISDCYVNEMLNLASLYYFGGNNVPNAATFIAETIKTKYNTF